MLGGGISCRYDTSQTRNPFDRACNICEPTVLRIPVHSTTRPAFASPLRVSSWVSTYWSITLCDPQEPHCGAGEGSGDRAQQCAGDCGLLCMYHLISSLFKLRPASTFSRSLPSCSQSPHPGWHFGAYFQHHWFACDVHSCRDVFR